MENQRFSEILTMKPLGYEAVFKLVALTFENNIKSYAKQNIDIQLSQDDSQKIYQKICQHSIDNVDSARDTRNKTNYIFKEVFENTKVVSALKQETSENLSNKINVSFSNDNINLSINNVNIESNLNTMLQSNINFKKFVEVVSTVRDNSLYSEPSKNNFKNS